MLEEALNKAQGHLHKALMRCLERNGSQEEITEISEAQRQINVVRAMVEGSQS